MMLKATGLRADGLALNESPSEKEGKWASPGGTFEAAWNGPSMKVPPKRKGNFSSSEPPGTFTEYPQ